jgi:hypothetical protein
MSASNLALDVRVEYGSALPQSRAARLASIMDLMNQGHIPSQEGLNMLKLGTDVNGLDEYKAHKRAAQKENFKYAQLTEEEIQAYYQEAMQEQQVGQDGQPVLPPLPIPVNTWDNHELHIKIHNLFRTTGTFERLPDLVKELLEAHVNQHKQMMMGAQLEAMLGMVPSDGSVEGIVPEQQGGLPGILPSPGSEELAPSQVTEATLGEG